MYLAMINIHNNMYHSINLCIHSSNPSIHRYGTHICQSFLTHGVCPFFTIPVCLSTMNDSGSPTTFYHNWSPYLLTTQLMLPLYHTLFSLKSTLTEMKLVFSRNKLKQTSILSYLLIKSHLELLTTLLICTY